MNKVFLIGNLTRDPEVVNVVDGNKACKIVKFDIAVNRRFTQDGEQKTDFYRVVSFRNLAEIVEKFLTKGSKIALSGSINTTEWEDKEGNAHKGVEIVADEIEFISIKRTEDQPKQESSRRRPKY